jgi:3-hydroxyacyl-CoA dehydrogenase
MACHYRVAAEGTRFGMPEVKLGFNPGGGGTQRLPRLVGAAAALEMMLSGEAIDAPKALALGLVDSICAADRHVEAACRWATGSPPRMTCQSVDKIADTAACGAALNESRKRLSRSRPEVLAPARIVDAVRVGLEQSFDAGSRFERAAFAECMTSPAARNKIYLFFATRKTGKVPELAGVAPRPVRQAAVVGMGSMGSGIVQALAACGVPTVVLDQDGEALRRGRQRIQSSLEKRVSQGRLTAAIADGMLQSIHTTTDWSACAPANLVIESVDEDLAVKRAVLKSLENVCPASTVIASNTSTISLDELAADMLHPERLIGMHFFNPAQHMPLLEVIRRESTPPEVLATALAMAKRMGKTPVVVANREGFLVSRVFVPYFQEAFALLEEGAAVRDIDRAAVEFGFPMGPLALIDLTGLDILVHAQRVLRRAFPRHGTLSRIVGRLVESGLLGQKSGAGVYRYEPGSYTPQDHETAARIIEETQREVSSGFHLARECIAQRLVDRMISEAFYVLEEGVARSAEDVDVAMVLSTGFPDFRGGLLKYANDLGRDTILARLEGWANQCGERFAPCRLLRKRGGTV